MKRREAVIIVMAKQPIVGQAKTRLSPFLTAEEAARVYEALLWDTIELVAQASEVADLAIAITPPAAIQYFEDNAPPGARFFPVAGLNIGACLDQVLSAALVLGYPKAIAINSDGPSLPPVVLEQAVTSLDDADVVIGPGEDGGYYLIGMKQTSAELFTSIDWSTPLVLRQTLARAATLGRRVSLTRPWYDIDTPDDLLRLQAELHSTHRPGLAKTRAVLGQLALETRPR